MSQKSRKSARRERAAKARSKPPAKAGQKRRVSPPAGRRVWFFRLAALIVAPVIFLLLMELGLRAVGYGYNPDVTVPCQIERVPHRGDNIQFGWRFFTPILAREFEPFVFPSRKPEGTCRIFVLGASAAQGVPNNAFRFGRILEFMLHERFPGARFEVVTAAMAAINSHVVLEIARDCARYEPDLFVVYLGNNEVVGPYGPGTVLTPALSNLKLIRAGIRLRATKVGQLLSGLLGGRRPTDKGPAVWRGMEMFLGQQVRADDPRLEMTYDHFRRNLEDICRTAAEAGADTVLCTVGANLRDCPPFASLHRSGLKDEEKARWDTVYEQGVAAESREAYREAIDLYLQAAAIDGSYAELQFRLGRCHESVGEWAGAHERYLLARDHDTLRFRADTRINDVIAAVAATMQSQRVYLADVVDAVQSAGPHGLAGKELFHEHVHLTFAGNYLVASTVLGQIERLLAQRGLEAGDALPTQDQCAARLAWNDWSRHQTLDTLVHSFLAKPPFTNQLDHAERVGRGERELAALEASLTPQRLAEIAGEYREVIASAPTDWRLRWEYGKMLAEDMKQYDAAASQYRTVLELLPHSHMGHDALAAVLRGRGDLSGAIAEYEKVVAIKPTAGTAYYYLGWCHEKMGRKELAADLYRQAIRCEPDCAPAYLDLGEWLFRQGRREEAAETLRDGIAVLPNHPLLRSNLGLVLIRMGRRQEGEREVRTALELDPNSPQIRHVAEQLLGPGAGR